MQFKLDANQEYQAAAVEAVVNLFEGQPNGRCEPWSWRRPCLSA